MIRNTRQREAILKALREARRPLSPAELHQLALRHHSGLGLRTVYRQIKDLTTEGLLVGIDYPGQPLRYEPVSGQHHAHFICRRCQQVFDLPGVSPEVTVEAPEGFVIDGQETVFYGICRECRAATANGS